MMDKKRHWEKLGAEEEWSDKARGERYMIIYIPDILDETWENWRNGRKRDVGGMLGSGGKAVRCVYR